MKKQKQNISASINDNIDTTSLSNINIQENESLKRERNFPNILEDYANKKQKTDGSSLSDSQSNLL